MISEKLQEAERPVFTTDNGRSLSDQVYDYLCDQFEQGKIQFGERLNIKKIAAQLDVSSMPIRDAIKRLELEHVVVVNPRSHCYVRIPRKQDVLDAIDARRMIENFAMSILYSHVRLEQLCGLDTIVERMRPIAKGERERGYTERLDEYIELDRQFHKELCTLAKNEYVDRFYRLVNMNLSMSFRYGMGRCHGVAVTFEEHETILHHMKAHSREALTVLDAHLMKSRHNIVKEPTFLSLPD